MKKVTFTVDGVDGEFECDADEFNRYETLEQLTFSDEDPKGFFKALGRIYMGKASEYADRVGGLDHMAALNEAAGAASSSKKA